ncbi:MAG: phytanoyl-CoA dioxygenase family protein [Planctomycetes bacterium]|nr:phytanoyl-CoA dioxygenase family protein [Planctomycetota bacterium]
MLTQAQRAEFDRDGYVVVPSFYDYEAEIRPIQFGIWSIIGLLLRKYGIPFRQPEFSGGTFDSGYAELIARDRRYGGEVYDAVKQIPAFMRLVSSGRNERLFAALRGTDAVGIAAGGYGIRIDNPREEKFRSLWHYEYRDQLRSVDGVVFWSPLVPVTQDMGPVQICPGSHVDGLRRSHLRDPEHPEKTGAYAMRIENEKALLDRFGIVAPTSNPGDLVLMDFLTLHSSGSNVGSRSRWSMQFRYFGFTHPSGIEIKWTGCVANGVQLKDVHPELVIDNA